MQPLHCINNVFADEDNRPFDVRALFYRTYKAHRVNGGGKDNPFSEDLDGADTDALLETNIPWLEKFLLPKIKQMRINTLIIRRNKPVSADNAVLRLLASHGLRVIVILSEPMLNCEARPAYDNPLDQSDRYTTDAYRIWPSISAYSDASVVRNAVSTAISLLSFDNVAGIVVAEGIAGWTQIRAEAHFYAHCRALLRDIRAALHEADPARRHPLPLGFHMRPSGRHNLESLDQAIFMLSGPQDAVADFCMLDTEFHERTGSWRMDRSPYIDPNRPASITEYEETSWGSLRHNLWRDRELIYFPILPVYTFTKRWHSDEPERLLGLAKDWSSQRGTGPFACGIGIRLGMDFSRGTWPFELQQTLQEGLDFPEHDTEPAAASDETATAWDFLDQLPFAQYVPWGSTWHFPLSMWHVPAAYPPATIDVDGSVWNDADGLLFATQDLAYEPGTAPMFLPQALEVESDGFDSD